MSQPEPSSPITTTQWWRRLWQPADTITDLGERRQAQLLFTLSLSFALLNGLSLFFLPSNLFLQVLLGTFAILMVVALSRTRYHLWGAILLTLLLTMQLFLRLPESKEVALYSFLPLIFLFASVLLPFRLTVLTICGNIILPFLLPLFTPAVTLSDLFAPMSAVSSFGVLMIITTAFRNNIERDRLKLLSQTNQELRNLQSGLDDQIQARTGELELAAAVGRSVTALRDLNTLLPEAVSLILTRFNLYYVQIYLLNSEGDTLILRAGTGPIGEELLRRGHKLPLDGGSINGRAALQSSPILVTDTLNSDIFRPNALLPATRSELAAPLIAGNQVLGVLDLQSSRINQLRVESLPAFEILAGQLAVALDNAELFGARDRANLALQQSQERLALVITGTNDGIWDWDIRTNQVYFSPRWKAMLGYTDAEISNDFAEFESRLHPDDHDRVMKMVADYLHGRIPTYEFEFRMQHKDGSYRWILVRAALVRDAQGIPLRMAGSHTDVSERKAGEEQLRLSQERFALAVAGTNDGIWDWDIPTNQVYFSSRWKSMLGYADTEISNDFAEFESRLHPDDHDWVMKMVDDYLHGRIPTYEFEFRMQHKDGSYRWILVRAALVRNAQGTPLRMAGSHTDVTARKAAEERLRLSQERFALAVAGTNDGIWDWDIPTNQVYFSSRWKSMLGYADTEISNDFAEFESRLHPDDHDQVMKMVDDYLHGRIPTYEFEFRLQHKDGSYRWILVRAALIRDAQGTPLRMAGSHTDVTARKAAEETIRQEQLRTQAILESVTTPLLITRLSDGSLLFANERTAEMVGLQVEELSSFSTLDFYTDPIARQEIIQHLQTQGFINNHEVQLRRYNGELFWGLISSRLFNFQGETAIVSTVVDITTRRNIELTLTLRAQELQIVAQVGTAAATILEPEHLLQEVVNLTKKHFQLYHAHIYLLSETGDTLLLHTGAGDIGQAMVAEGRQINIRQAQSLVARAARTRQGVVVNDVQQEAAFLPHSLLPETRAEMAVPLIAGTQLLGVLDVQANVTGRFTAEEVGIFTTLAAQVAVALQNARRYHETQQALNELTRIQHVLVREGWQEFLLAHERPLQGFYFDRQTAHPINHLDNTPNPLDITPLIVRGQTIGKIGVRPPAGTSLNGNQRQLLTTLSNQVSDALERTRLAEQTQLALTEAKTLSELSARLNAVQTYQQINDIVKAILATRTNNTIGAILFAVQANPQGQPEQLNLLATSDTTGIADSFVRHAEFMMNPDAPWATLNSLPILITDIEQDPRLLQLERQIYQRIGYRSVAFLPLRLAGQWVGLVSLFWRETVRFTTTDERLIAAMVDQIALAVNSIQLLRAAQQRARQEQLLREISTRVSAAVDAQSVLQTATREIGRALGLETFVYLKSPDPKPAAPMENGGHTP